jgi:hypothetical protein
MYILVRLCSGDPSEFRQVDSGSPALLHGVVSQGAGFRFNFSVSFLCSYKKDSNVAIASTFHMPSFAFHFDHFLFCKCIHLSIIRKGVILLVRENEFIWNEPPSLVPSVSLSLPPPFSPFLQFLLYKSFVGRKKSFLPLSPDAICFTTMTIDIYIISYLF